MKIEQKGISIQNLFNTKPCVKLPEKPGDIQQLIRSHALDTIMILDLKRQNIMSI